MTTFRYLLGSESPKEVAIGASSMVLQRSVSFIVVSLAGTAKYVTNQFIDHLMTKSTRPSSLRGCMAFTETDQANPHMPNECPFRLVNKTL